MDQIVTATRPPPPLRRGGRRGRRARRRDRLLRARAASARSWARPAPGKSTLMHILAGLDRPTSGYVELDGAEITGARRRRPHQAAPRQARLHLPVLQPDPGPHGGGEHRAAAVDRGPQGRRGVADAADRHRRARRPPHAPAGRALGRPAAARGRGPGAGVASPPWCSPTSPPATSTRRRARRCCSLLRQLGGRVRADRGDGHPRSRGGLVRRPAGGAARRQGGARRRGGHAPTR